MSFWNWVLICVSTKYIQMFDLIAYLFRTEMCLSFCKQLKVWHIIRNQCRSWSWQHASKSY